MGKPIRGSVVLITGGTRGIRLARLCMERAHDSSQVVLTGLGSLRRTVAAQLVQR